MLKAKDYSVGNSPTPPPLSENNEDEDCFDHLNFNPFEYINRKLKNVQSLDNIDFHIHRISKRMQILDQDIRVVVRDQSKMCNSKRKDISEVKDSIKNLAGHVSQIYRHTEECEYLVNTLCSDIRNLETAKQNLTLTITSLKKLVMLTAAMDQLRVNTAERNYGKVSYLITAIRLLIENFKTLSYVPRIKELIDQRDQILRELKKAILEDFDTIFDPDFEVVPNLRDACRVIDAISADIQKEIICMFCMKLLEPYKLLFQPPNEASNFNNVQRRFSWYKRNSKELEEKYLAIFPLHWAIEKNFAEYFCRITRYHIVELLSSQHHQIEPLQMYRTLVKSVEFENSLASKFESSILKAISDFERQSWNAELVNVDRETLSALTNAGLNPTEFIDWKNGTEGTANSKIESAEISPSNNRRFKGLISECFEAYLWCWYQYEEQLLLSNMKKLVQPSFETVIAYDGISESSEKLDHDNDDEDMDSPRRVYKSATELFTSCKICLDRVMAVPTYTICKEMFHIIKKVLCRYFDTLQSRVPSAKRDLYLSEDEMSQICSVVGTAGYIDQTLPLVAAMIAKCVDDAHKPEFQFSEETEILRSLKVDCSKSLMTSLENFWNSNFALLCVTDWSNVDEIGQRSNYVRSIIDNLEYIYDYIVSRVSTSFFRLICDKIAQSFIPRFANSIVSCRKISEMGVQQLLLDCYALRMTLLEGPVKSHPSIALRISYTRFITREMGHIEVMLKDMITKMNS